MKKYYTIYQIREGFEVCTPSTSYYSKGNDWDRDTIYNTLRFIDEKDTEEEALDVIKDALEENDTYRYTILITYHYE